MAGAGGIVAQGLGGEGPDEDGPGGGDALDQSIGLDGLQGEVFRRVEIGHLAGLGHIAHADGATLGQRGAGDVGAGQGPELAVHLGEDGVDIGAAFGDEDDLGVGVVFSLAEQVGGGDFRICVAVGDDQQFRRAGGHVDGRAAGQVRRLFLGLGNPGIAGSEQLVTGLDDAVVERGAEGQGGDGLGPADQPEFIETGLCGGEDHGGVRLARGRGRGHGDAAADTGDGGRNGQHQQGGEQWGRAAGDIEPRRAQRPPDQPRSDAGDDLDIGGVFGPGRLVEDADVLGGHTDRPGVCGAQGIAGGGDAVGCQNQTFRGGSIKLEAPVGHGRAAARADIVHDLAHRVGDACLGAAAGAGQSLASAGFVEGAPVDPFHHIIFSIGRTRMAEAPAALSRSSVSQKTAS